MWNRLHRAGDEKHELEDRQLKNKRRRAGKAGAFHIEGEKVGLDGNPIRLFNHV